MINSNALPTSSTVQDFQNLESALDSPDYNDTLQAMQYMKRRPTGGLNRLPQVTVPMQEGGMMEEAMMQEEQMPVQPMNPEEQAMMMQQVEQQEPREPNPEIQAMAQQVASYGRGGDKLLLHINPNEMQGLSSMLNVTINPTTGMPEVFLNKIVRAGKRLVKGAGKVLKSDAFKTLAPIALAIAAPYAAAYMGFGTGATLSAKVASMGPGMFGFTTGLGSLTGNLLAGRSFKDSAKAGLISGVTAGTFRGISNKMQGKTFMGGTPESARQPILSEGRALEVADGTSPFTGDTTYTPGVDGGYGGTFTDPKVTEASGTLEAFRKQQAEIAARGADKLATQFGTGATETTSTNLLSKLGDYTPESVKQIGSAIGQDFNPFTKEGLVNIASKGLSADIGGSYVEMEEQKELARRRQEEEDEALKRAGYRVEYPDGYDSQRVVYDMSGVVPIRTIDEILNRSLGGGRFLYRGRTTYEPTEDLVETAQGGLINLAAGGEFSGIVPGQGSGMDDNVYMPIKEGREQVGTLAVSPTEYVVDSYTMAALGDGNPEEGARVMDKTIKQIRQKAFGNTKQPKEIDGLAALRPMVQGV